MISRRVAATAVLVVAIASTADAAGDDFFHRLVADARARVSATIAARTPVLVPPVKVAVHWRLVKLGSVDLGAPLLAMTGADLDGDGHGEIYAVTAKEVIALGMHGKKLDELGRVAFPGERAMPAPRDVVATAVADGGSVLVAASTWSRSMRVHWQNKTLVGELAGAGFTLCPGEVAQLAPGRNYFGDAQTGMYGARCRTTLVDPAGHPLRIRAVLSLANKLDVAVEAPPAHHEYGNAGFAFELADVDRDGRPEVIYAAAGAPGDPDVLRVVSLGDDEKKPRLKKQFAAGGIAGIAATDLDRDGIEDVVAAVRLVGSSRADLWRLE